MTKTREEILEEIEALQARIAELKAQLPKQSRRLTAAICRDAKHSGARGPDRLTSGAGGYGLALVIKQSGAKSFTQRLTIAGKRTDVGLGPFPEISLQQAMDAAFENRRIVRAGGTLADLVRPDGAPPACKPRKAAGVPTLAEAAATVIAIQAHGWREGGRTREAWESNLRRYAFPELGETAVSLIGAPELLKVVEPLWGTKSRPLDDMLNRLSVSSSGRRRRATGATTRPRRYAPPCPATGSNAATSPPSRTRRSETPSPPFAGTTSARWRASPCSS